MRMIRAIIALGVLIIGGLFFLIGGLKDKADLKKPMTDFSELSYSNLEDGMFVTGTIVELWDDFAYETEDNRTSLYFAMPLETSFELEEPVFVALSLRNSDEKDIAKKMSKETDDYYIRDIEPAVWTELEFTGQVSKLKGEILDYFEEYVEEMGFSPSTSMQPYVINKYAEGNENIRIIIGAVMLSVGLLIVGLFVFFRFVKGRR